MWIIGSVIALFLLIVLLLQIPYFQNIVKDKAVTYLEEKIGTDVNIDNIEIGLPKKVILEGIYFESQQGDTLFSGEKLKIDISLFKLLSNEVEINSVDLQGIVANVKRNKDSVFNFDYIIDAFATNKPKDTTSSSMAISIKNINLDKIRVNYDDDITKNYLSANLTHFDTHIAVFDLENQGYEIPDINLDGLKVKFKQAMVKEISKSTQKVAEDASSKPDLKLSLKNISIANIEVSYDNVGSNLDTGLKLEKLVVKVDNIDLKKQLIALDNLELNGVRGQLAIGTFEKQVQQSLPEASPEVASSQWKFSLKESDIKNVAFKYDDMNSPPVKKGIDYKHLNITNFNLEANDLAYYPDSIAGAINKFTVREQSGLDVESLKTEFFYGPKGAQLNDLYLETPQTLLRDKIQVSYPSLEAVSTDLASITIDADLKSSQIGFKDVLLFAPQLADTNPFKDNPNGSMFINSRVQGTLDNLYISNIEIRGIGRTVLAASGRIKGLPDVKTAYFDLNVREFKSTAKDINSLLPPGTLPASIKLPQSIAAKVKFKGTLDNFNTSLNLASSYGKANINANFDQRNKGKEKYDGKVDIQNFDVGSLLQNDSIGRVTLIADVKGTGLDPKTANAILNGKLVKAEYNNYTYRDLAINGNIKNGTFEATANMQDPNLDFDLVASGGFKGEYPQGKINLNIDIADLNKLNLHAGPLKMRGNVDADIADLNPNNLNGKISLHHFMFANAEEEFALDSVNVIAESTPDTNIIKIRSQIIDADVNGKYQVTNLPTALSRTISKYYNTGTPANDTVIPKQDLVFSMRIKDDPILPKLLPQLTRIEPVVIVGRYNSATDSLMLNAIMPRIEYGSNNISGLVINLSSSDTALVYSVKINEIKNEQFLISQTSLTGDIKNNIVNYTLAIDDRKKSEQYRIAGQLKASEGTNEISLNQDGLMLNYEEWTIAPDNVIRFGSDGIYANNFEMQHEQNAIKIQSESEKPNAPLNVELENFEIETLTNMIQKEELKFRGKINGKANIKDLAADPVFTANLDITNFAVAKDTVGNIAINVDNKTADNIYTAKVAITGQGNQVNLDGTYNTSASNFDMNLDMQRLNIASLQALTFGALNDGGGYLSGKFDITGSTTDPNVNGNLDFNNVSFKVTQLNAKFKSINDNIVFSDSGIEMNNFKIEDEKNNLLTINGDIATTDYQSFGFDMNVTAVNFRAVNSTAKDNDLYYGDLYLDTDLDIKGTLESPVISGDLKINEDTKFTVVLPQQDPSIADREGVVEFVDEDNVAFQQRLKMEEAVNTSDVTGMDVSVNIEIVKEAELNLIIDKGNGDYLRLKGQAQLNGGIDPSGKTTLTGRYEFTEGAYEMTFNFIKRKFDIQQGSYLLWTGEPTEASIDITAVYKTEAAPIDLVDDQLGGFEAGRRNTYKQKIPFNTLLIMKGELLEPQLSFDIQVPDGNYNVSSEIINTTKAKLEQLRQEPSELNKQVFALLLLNRFIGENPFSSEAGSANAETLARQSVSKILSQQLNNLASDLINGVELNFDLESTEDYTTGRREDRTDLNVGVSKRLFNDRLKVTVGSSFGLEGQQANEETTNIAGDISVDYQLTQDGRYLVRAYRTNDYQIALQGQVIETGVSFIITMDYNKFRELFHRTEEEKKMKARERERKQRQKEERKREKAEAEQQKAAEDDLPPNSTKSDNE
ncbi:translocation/assembly module TamB domain-containing protein [Flavobacterium sp. ST-119]|uniref:Translocation/assembly module TamB domain-containing protein n=1 Tax=Flavobacterium rhizosphaerae TaxID=3163298 RepID=A0ABW8YSV3_9FLAO